MTPVRPAISILLLFVAPFSGIRVEAGLCDPTAILGQILGTGDQTTEWLAKHFQRKDIKNFDADLYFKTKEEFRELKIAGQLPVQPPAAEFEKNLAWVDAETETGEKLPSLISVLEKGTANQKRRLSKWIKHYSGKKLTEYQIKEASSELSLILNNTKYSISELYEHGANGLAQKMVTSQYHQALIEKQLIQAIQENQLLKKENIINALNRISNTSPGKWILNGGLNGYSFTNAQKWTKALLFSLPDHQWARLSVEDFETLMKTGGVNSPLFEKIAAKYKGTVRFQVLYNSAQDLTTVVARLLWIDYGIRKYQEYQEHQAKIDTKDHS